MCMSLVGFQASKIWMFFGKFYVELLKSFSDRNNSLKPVFGFCDSFPFDMEESVELRALISWVLIEFMGIQNCKKFLPTIFLCF